MAKFELKKKVKTPGEAQDFLRSIIREIDQGYRSGKGWKIGEGEIEVEEAPKIEGLEESAKALRYLILDEDLSDEKLREASEGLLPTLSDTLSDAGYGVIEDTDEVKKPEVSTEGKEAGGGPGGVTDDDANAPWNKKK